MRKYILLLLIASLTFSIASQPVIDELALDNSVIQVNYDKKSTRLAVTMSAILPGAGSVYVNPSRWVGYIFPIIEGALIYGYISTRQDAIDQERAYEKYVNGETISLYDPVSGNLIYSGPRFNRELQSIVESYISDINTNDIYDLGENGFYRLDQDDTQHFYEDVGKYDKYVYGWADWFERYAYNGSGTLLEGQVAPIVQWSTNSEDVNHTIIGHELTNSNYTENINDGFYSPMREKYIKMRKDAQKQYNKADLFIYGMLLNRVVSAVDAGLAVKRYNKNYISQSTLEFNYAATSMNDRFTPMVYLTQRF